MENTNPPNEIAVVVRLPRDLRDELRRRAAREDRSVASVMRQAARAYLQVPEHNRHDR